MAALNRNPNHGYIRDADIVIAQGYHAALAEKVGELIGTRAERRLAYSDLELFMNDLKKFSVGAEKAGNVKFTDLLKALKSQKISWPIAPLLAWLCYHHPDEAKIFYKDAKIFKGQTAEYRKYIGEPGAWAKARNTQRIRSKLTSNETSEGRVSGVTERSTDVLLVRFRGDNIGSMDEVLRSLGQAGIKYGHVALHNDITSMTNAESAIDGSLVPALLISTYLLTQMRLNANFARDVDRFVKRRGDDLFAIRLAVTTQEIRRESQNLADLAFIDLHIGHGRMVEQLSRAVQLRRSDEHGLHGFKLRLTLRQAGQDFIEEELSKTYSASRTSSMSIAVVDIDKLAQINRKFGYDAGDYVVYALGGIIAEHIGSRDHRIELCGADAYVVYVPSDDMASVMDGLTSKVAEVVWEIWPDLSVTCSIGYAVRQEREVGIDVAIRAAKGMNSAKQKGGNRMEEGPRNLEVRTSRRVSSYVS